MRFTFIKTQRKAVPNVALAHVELLHHHFYIVTQSQNHQRTAQCRPRHPNDVDAIDVATNPTHNGDRYSPVSGEITAPCGVPTCVFCWCAPSITPALKPSFNQP